MNPPVACRVPRVSLPRRVRRDGGVCPPHLLLVPPDPPVAPTAPVSTPASVMRPPGLRSQIPSPTSPGQIQSP